MSVPVTATEMQMLQNLRVKADELARTLQEVNAAGFQVNFNLNAVLGACDVFDVIKMVKVDLRGSAN